MRNDEGGAVEDGEGTKRGRSKMAWKEWRGAGIGRMKPARVRAGERERKKEGEGKLENEGEMSRERVHTIWNTE